MITIIVPIGKKLLYQLTRSADRKLRAVNRDIMLMIFSASYFRESDDIMIIAIVTISCQ